MARSSENPTATHVLAAVFTETVQSTYIPFDCNDHEKT